MEKNIHIRDTFRTAIQALVTHKGRSFLTVLGIVIGIMAIMIVMALGSSATELIVKEVESFGPENVFINPGKPSSGGFSFSSGASSLLLKSLTEKDVSDLGNKNFVPDAVAVNPSVQTSVTVSYQSEVKTTSVLGTSAQAFSIYNISAQKGRSFDQGEVDDKASVAVIGKNVAKDLFGLQNPVGEKIKIKNAKFTVIGVFSSLGSSMFGIDDLVITPYTTLQQNVLGTRYFQEIAVQARDAEAVPNMVRDIKTLLRDNHSISDPLKDNFIVTTQADIIDTVNNIMGAVTAFLAFVAAMSLVVGGIGVMNIMFVSVTERTREIGLRKALGATRKDILFQFLLEAVMLTSFGGLLGIAGGALFTYLGVLIASLATGLSFPFYFSVTGSVLGIVVSCGAGIAFGIFPARQAAEKSPIEALRYE